MQCSPFGLLRVQSLCAVDDIFEEAFLCSGWVGECKPRVAGWCLPPHISADRVDCGPHDSMPAVVRMPSAPRPPGSCWHLYVTSPVVLSVLFFTLPHATSVPSRERCSARQDERSGMQHAGLGGWAAVTAQRCSRSMRASDPPNLGQHLGVGALQLGQPGVPIEIDASLGHAVRCRRAGRSMRSQCRCCKGQGGKWQATSRSAAAVGRGGGASCCEQNTCARPCRAAHRSLQAR